MSFPLQKLMAPSSSAGRSTAPPPVLHPEEEWDSTLTPLCRNCSQVHSSDVAIRKIWDILLPLLYCYCDCYRYFTTVILPFTWLLSLLHHYYIYYRLFSITVFTAVTLELLWFLHHYHDYCRYFSITIFTIAVVTIIASQLLWLLSLHRHYHGYYR